MFVVKSQIKWTKAFTNLMGLTTGKNQMPKTHRILHDFQTHDFTDFSLLLLTHKNALIILSLVLHITSKFLLSRNAIQIQGASTISSFGEKQNPKFIK